MAGNRDYVLHSDNEPRRLDRQAELIGIESFLPLIPFAPGEHILDAACGSGSMTRLLARSVPNSQITAVELRADYLAYAERTAREQGIDNADFVEGNLLDLPFASDSFDGCWSSLVLHWLAEDGPAKALEEIVRVVRPGGWVVCTEPDGLGDNTYFKEPDLAADWSNIMHDILDPDMGRKLCSVMHEAGLESLSVNVRPYWLNALGAMDPDVLDMWTELQQAMMPTMARILGSQEKAERFCERILDNFKLPDTLFFPLSFTVSGRKPT